MFDTVETKKHMCLLLDYCLGGDMFYLLTKYTRFPEKVARFYLCEMILALEHLHSENILYRDLKPTNIMIDEEGHVKLIDFGLSIPGFTETSVSNLFCGTPEYMAPEMLLKIGHNRSIDYYSIGILLYEMLVGIPPFYNNDRKTMYTSILKDEIKLFQHITKDAKDLILKLTQKEPLDRLGSNYGFFEIKQHPFFRGVNWINVYDKKLKPPYIP
jgi:serine/threonine protein kinase